MESIIEGFQAAVRSHPHLLAVVGQDFAMTRLELDLVSSRLAHRLVAGTTGKGERVAVLMRHGGPLFMVLLAVLKAGRVVVVLNPADPDDHLSHLHQCSGATMVVTDPPNVERARRLFPPEQVLQPTDIPPEDGVETHPWVPLQGSDLACIVFTSGTTGRPKGVPKTHHALLDQATRLAGLMDIQAGDKILHLASPGGGQGFGTFAVAILTGAVLCPFPLPEKGVAGLAALLTDHDVGVVISSASVFRHFVRTLPADAFFPKVRLVRLASEPAMPEDFHAFRRHFSAQAVLLHSLASSETGLIAAHQVTVEDCLGEGPLPVGRPLPGVGLKLVDERGNEITDGRTGEIVLTGSGFSSGYWGQHAADTGLTRTLHTGDQGRWREDGCLVFVGRGDDRVKIRGNRIHLGHVEAAARTHPSLCDALVAARPRHDGGAELVAFLVRKPGGACTAGEIRSFLQSSLPVVMVPSRFYFVEDIPLTPTGKRDRQALLQSMGENPAPEEAAAVRPALATPAQETVGRIWREVLGCAFVGPDSAFFELGGDSLSAAVAAVRIEEETGVAVEMRDLLESRLSELAEKIDRLRHRPSNPPSASIPFLDRALRIPLSFAQERIWRYAREPSVSAAYNVSVSYAIHGPLDAGLLRNCVAQIFARHEALRTSFHQEEGVPVQRVHDDLVPDFQEEDFSDSEAPEGACDVWFATASGVVFDLSQAPLVQFRLARLGRDTHRLLRVGHHIITDGWSWRIFFEELGALYHAAQQGMDAEMEELPRQYRDFAAWEQQQLSRDSTGYREMMQWWIRQFSRETPALQLACRRPVPDDAASVEEAVFWLGIPAALSSSLKDLANRSRVTPYAVRLAALSAVIAGSCGQSRFVAGGYVSNRVHRETQRMFGLFLNLVTLPFDCDTSLTFREWVAATSELVLAAQSHAAIPYEQVCATARQEGITPPEIRLIFNMNSSVQRLRLGEAELTQPRRRIRTMPWGLSITMDPANEQTGCRVDFDARLYDPAGVRRLITQFVNLLENGAAQPELTLAGLLQRGAESHKRDNG